MPVTTPIRARLTHHARQRAAERFISTKAIKRTLAEPSLTYPSRDKRIAMSDRFPGLKVVYVEEAGERTAITAFWTGTATRATYAAARSLRRPDEMVARLTIPRTVTS